MVGFGLSTRATALDLLHERYPLDDGTDKPADWKVRTTTAHVQSERVELAELPVEDVIPLHAAEITLDTVALHLRAGQLVVLSGEQADAVGVVASGYWRPARSSTTSSTRPASSSAVPRCTSSEG